MTEEDVEESIAHDYVFGFGSIINTATHAPWIAELGDAGLKGQRARNRVNAWI